MGSAYPTIAADVMARFHRLQGVEVRFITGTDEHGEKIALAASKRGMDPKDHCDDVVESYKRLWEDVSYLVQSHRDIFRHAIDTCHTKLMEQKHWNHSRGIKMSSLQMGIALPASHRLRRSKAHRSLFIN